LIDIVGATATNQWYDEIALYDFNNPGFSEEAGHFTQVVWKDSQKLGVGYATGKQGRRYTLYVVAQYSPAGNEDDFFSQNVLPSKC
jgi:hypothetical protein